jgi:Asp-tRNA(Asn)/Glu-tRNA(Gln) amidotransferase B subunit
MPEITMFSRKNYFYPDLPKIFRLHNMIPMKPILVLVKMVLYSMEITKDKN